MMTIDEFVKTEQKLLEAFARSAKTSKNPPNDTDAQNWGWRFNEYKQQRRREARDRLAMQRFCQTVGIERFERMTKKAVLGILTGFGMSVRSRRGVTWDGKTLKAGVAGDEADYYLHELGHYLVCPKERRLVWNYGLGPAPGDDPKNIYNHDGLFVATAEVVWRTISTAKSNREEELAVWASSIVMAGYNWDFRSTLSEINANGEPEKTVLGRRLAKRLRCLERTLPDTPEIKLGLHRVEQALRYFSF